MTRGDPFNRPKAADAPTERRRACPRARGPDVIRPTWSWISDATATTDRGSAVAMRIPESASRAAAEGIRSGSGQESPQPLLNGAPVAALMDGPGAYHKLAPVLRTPGEPSVVYKGRIES